MGKPFAFVRVPRRHELRNLEKAISFSKPAYITSFSRIKGKANTWKLGGQPPVYRDPKLGSSLVEGFEEHKEPTDDSTLDFVTDAIDSSFPKLLPKFRGFVTYRNNLNKILATPYLRNEYDISARIKDGYIRLDVVKKDDPVDNRSQRFMYMGRKFEELCAHSEREHCVVMRLKLGNHELMVGAEIDAVMKIKEENNSSKGDSNDEKYNNKWVELKTSSLIESERQQKSFEKYKLLKFWIQSFLVGVPIIKCGYRKGDHLEKIETIETLRIPSRVREKGYWSGNVCLNYANRVLNFIRSSVKDPSKIYTISFKDPWDKIVISANSIK
eukprot:CAMPEP_0167748158 /NCGR_PEP_ID=MMETSP0110_2-20121227/4686_1 /TAXON_ID=629695 /ORGANISM="Gymnochlora sp., Strain CCMP2014" /LENGTH=326 /DNA_ID=CAMNT_0007633149 /DNA_START=151 /DNA_END=1131 /DNA_ORIENTATION=-